MEVDSLLRCKYRAASLAQSIFNVRRFKLHGSRATAAAKLVSILLPILFICLLRVESVQYSIVAFLVIANILSKWKVRVLLACRY